MTMYVPAHFREEDQESIHALVRSSPFGLLLTNGSAVPEVTHLPMLLEVDPSGERILGHLALANPHAKMLQTGACALAVFSGEQGYITPRWYADPNLVPTWNYRVVHAHGTVRRVEEEPELMALVDALTAVHESGAQSPWSADWSNPKVSRLLKAIVGFELQVTRWEAKAKLSQNRAPEDQEALRKNLLAHDQPETLVHTKTP